MLKDKITNRYKVSLFIILLVYIFTLLFWHFDHTNLLSQIKSLNYRPAYNNYKVSLSINDGYITYDLLTEYKSKNDLDNAYMYFSIPMLDEYISSYNTELIETDGGLLIQTDIYPNLQNDITAEILKAKIIEQYRFISLNITEKDGYYYEFIKRFN